MNQKKLLSLLGFAVSIGSLSPSEFRAPMVSQQGPLQGPMRYDMLAKPDKWSFDTWSMTLFRSAERSFVKHDVKTKELPTAFFDQERFTIAQAFGDVNKVLSSNMNVNINATQFFPVATYSEYSAVFGGRFEYPVWHNKGRIGVRAMVPFRTVRTERDNDAERAEVGNSEVHAQKVPSVPFTVIGSDGTRVVVQDPANANPALVASLSPLAVRTAALNIPVTDVVGGTAQVVPFLHADGGNLVVGNIPYKAPALALRDMRDAGSNVIPYSFIKVSDGNLPVGNMAVPVYVLSDQLLQTAAISFQEPAGTELDFAGGAGGAVGTGANSSAARLVQNSGDGQVFNLITPGSYTTAVGVAVQPGSPLIRVEKNAGAAPTIRFLAKAAVSGLAKAPDDPAVIVNAFDANGILDNALGIGDNLYETFSALLATYNTPADTYRVLNKVARANDPGDKAALQNNLAVTLDAGGDPLLSDRPNAGVLAAATNTRSSFGGLQPLPDNLDDMVPNTVYVPIAGQGPRAADLLARTDVWMIENRASDDTFGGVAEAISNRLQNGLAAFGTLSAEQWLNGCNILMKTDQETGLGDIDVDLFYEHTFNDDLRGEVVLGVRLPTGGSKKYCNNPYKVQLGNGNHTEIKLGGMIAWQALDWLSLKGMASYSFALKSKEDIPTPLKGATVKGIGRCIEADVDWGYFVGRLDLQFYHPKTDRLASSFGYEFYYKTKDNVTLKSSTADLTCLFGQALNAGDTGITQAVLDRSVAERHTDRIAHRLRAESNFRLNQYFNLYIGGAYTFAGQHIPRESDLYAGTSVRF